MNLITTLILAVLAQQTPTASIEGVVVQIGTAQPVANAIVELSGDGALCACTIDGIASATAKYPAKIKPKNL